MRAACGLGGDGRVDVGGHAGVGLHERDGTRGERDRTVAFTQLGFAPDVFGAGSDDDVAGGRVLVQQQTGQGHGRPQALRERGRRR